MNYNPYMYHPYPNYGQTPYPNYGTQPVYPVYPNQLEYSQQPYRYYQPSYNQRFPLRDFGKEPFVVNIDKVTKQNNTFRTAIWTGTHLQVTLMSINVGEDIGLEVHPDVDQFLRIEEGQGLVQMGDTKDRLNFQQRVADDFAVMVPAGKWHNITNTGNTPLKIYTIYAPPEHPFGTVHNTKADAMAAEHHE